MNTHKKPTQSGINLFINRLSQSQWGAVLQILRITQGACRTVFTATTTSGYLQHFLQAFERAGTVFTGVVNVIVGDFFTNADVHKKIHQYSKKLYPPDLLTFSQKSNQQLLENNGNKPGDTIIMGGNQMLLRHLKRNIM